MSFQTPTHLWRCQSGWFFQTPTRSERKCVTGVWPMRGRLGEQARGLVEIIWEREREVTRGQESRGAVIEAEKREISVIHDLFCVHNLNRATWVHLLPYEVSSVYFLAWTFFVFYFVHSTVIINKWRYDSLISFVSCEFVFKISALKNKAAMTCAAYHSVVCSIKSLDWYLKS